MNSQKQIHCPHFRDCSGCTLDEDVNHPPVLKEVEAFFKKQEVSFTYFSDQATAWRYRAKLAIRGSFENPKIGLYEAGTHDVVNIPFCRVHHPHINQAVEKIRRWVQNCRIQPYNEKTREGVLRYVQCVVERSSGKVQLTLVINASRLDACSIDWMALVGDDSLWHSLWINLNDTPTNTIFGKEWQLIKGEEYLWEMIAGTWVCFHPANFAQANISVFEKLLVDLNQEVPKNVNIVEYYAGVGVIGFSLADSAKSVQACEINPWAEKSFNQTMLRQEKKNCSFFKGLATDYLHLLPASDVIVVDPPRKGLDRALLKALLEVEKGKDLWYISCGWPSFKRDCEELLEGWDLINAHAYLFFPGTDHLEIMAHLKSK